MGKICANCGYERKIDEIAPYYECPNCGVVYARSDKNIEEQRKEEFEKLHEQQMDERWSKFQNKKQSSLFTPLLSIFTNLWFWMLVPGIFVFCLLAYGLKKSGW